MPQRLRMSTAASAHQCERRSPAQGLDLPQGAEEPHRQGGDAHGTCAAEQDGGDGAEERRCDAGFQLAELVGGSDEEHVHRADPAPTACIWRAIALATHAPQKRAKDASRSSDGRASGELTSGNREASASVFS